MYKNLYKFLVQKTWKTTLADEQDAIESINQSIIYLFTFSFNANRTFVRNITFIARKTCSPSTIQSSHVFISKIKW